MKAYLQGDEKGLVTRLRRGRHGLPTERVAESQKLRLLLSITQCVGEKGYAAVTIAEVTANADVSKKTFYAHFQSKEQCFTEAYRSFSEYLLDAIDAAYRTAEGPWRARYAAGARAYLGTLAQHPVIARALVLEVLAAGPEVQALRSEILTRFATQMKAIHRRARAEDRRVPVVDPRLFTIAVGGVDELVRMELGRQAEPDLDALFEVLTLNYNWLLRGA